MISNDEMDSVCTIGGVEMCFWEDKTYAFNIWLNITVGIYTSTQGHWYVIEFGAQLTTGYPQTEISHLSKPNFPKIQEWKS